MTGLRLFLKRKMAGLLHFQKKKTMTGPRLFSELKISNFLACGPMRFLSSLKPLECVCVCVCVCVSVRVFVLLEKDIETRRIKFIVKER